MEDNNLNLSNQPRKFYHAKPGVMAVILLVLVLVITFSAGLVVGLNKKSGGINNASGDFSNLGQVINKDDLPEYLIKKSDFKLFWKVWDLIKSKYVDRSQITESQLLYGALAGSVAALNDPYSAFLNPENAKKFNDELSGKFEGIGAEVGIKKDRLTVIAPLPDSPAEKAGLRPQDQIVAIDGQETTNMLLDYAISLIRGEKGSEVVLTVFREKENKTLDIKIVRDAIVVKSVKLERKDGFAYITLTSFNTDTSSEFKKIAQEIVSNPPQGIILDLRNNTGGFLDTAIDIAGYWIDENLVIVKETFSDPQNNNDYVSQGQAQLKSFKTVVLINGGSASASEILAGALQDYKLATLIGETTFGKGSVQELEDLGDGSSLKLTVARWLTPQGRFIDQEGINPDITVELTEDDNNNDKDPQMDKAMELLKNSEEAVNSNQ